MPWPTTSPTTSPTRLPESGITSNQSPPMPASDPHGRYRWATSTAAWPGSPLGSRLCWRAWAVSRSRAKRRALSTQTAARLASSSAKTASSGT